MKSTFAILESGIECIKILQSEGHHKLSRTVARQTLQAAWLEYRLSRVYRQRRKLREAMLDTQYQMLILDEQDK